MSDLLDHIPPVPELRLAELLGALSHALDMVEGQPAGHCVRCCCGSAFTSAARCGFERTANLGALHRAGTWFDRQLAAAFERVAAREEFWTVLRSDELQTAIFELEPAQQRSFVNEDYLDDIAAAFAQVIDSKSPYTSGHSERVTLFTDLITEQLDFTPERRRRLRRAALLHDIGKLGSNSILDKPGKFDAGEWAAMQKHTTLGETILSRIAAFRDLAAIAGSHHERLDAKGYPRGLTASELPLEVRIVTTADIFDALTADWPYRAAMPVEKALAIMSDMLGTQIDPVPFNALKSALKRANAQIAA